jgi:YD repeat-containing protein
VSAGEILACFQRRPDVLERKKQVIRIGRLATKIDAKGQKVAYTYDSYGRQTQVQRYYPSGGSLVEDATQRTTYYYETNPFDASYSQHAQGRVAAIQYHGGNCTSLGPPRSDDCDTIEEMFNYDVPGNTLGKRLRLIRGSAQGDLNGSWTYDSYGKMTGVTYPQWTNASQTVPGSNYTSTFDTMMRPNKLHNYLANTDVISAVTYGVANEELSLSGILNETRTYNTLFQLTRITVPGALDIQYAYSATQNNTKLTSQTDVISGEQVTYTYDSLNRLATAVTTDNPNVTQWGQSYTYDGFGNLTDQNVIKGSAPTMHTWLTTPRPTGRRAMPPTPTGTSDRTIPTTSRTGSFGRVRPDHSTPMMRATSGSGEGARHQHSMRLPTGAWTVRSWRATRFQ